MVRPPGDKRDVSHLNVEIKARCERIDAVREILRERQALFVGVDHQVDTYYRSPRGRLKLREGNIECALIHYHREDESGPKESRVTLYHPSDPRALKEILARCLGVLVVVRKEREIYFIDNVKFHLDTVEKLGSFVEIEAIDQTGTIGKARLLGQCEAYMRALAIETDDLVSCSYSDMLLHLDRAATDPAG